MSDVKKAIDQLATSGIRIRVHNAQTVIKLPKVVKDLVKDVARSRSTSENRYVSEAEIVREAIAEYLTRRGYNR